MLCGPTSAAQYTVTKTDDTNDGACTSTDCSLREAIIAANATSDADEIMLPAGTYELSLTGDKEDSAASGDLDVKATLTLIGAGPDASVIDAMQADRVFHILGATVTISNVTLRNGRIAGPCAGTECFGGGILTEFQGDNPALTLTHCILSDNSADEGGGIYAYAGTLIISDCTVSNNVASSRGGGINFLTDRLTIIDSTLDNNSAVRSGGGGIYLGGTATLVNCTLSNNNSAGDFGAGGGGIEMIAHTRLSLINCTLTGNSTEALGGGLVVAGFGADAAFTNCTLAGNSAHEGSEVSVFVTGTVTFTNSIIAGSSSGGSCSGPGLLIDGGHNLQYPGSDCGETIRSLEPSLDPAGLQDNGGATQTLALCTAREEPAGCAEASPAIDGGDQAVCRGSVGNRDQRGFVRPGIGHAKCSIGAYEADAEFLAVCVGDCDSSNDVTVSELVRGVNIALGRTDLNTCRVFDFNEDQEVGVNELVLAVEHALRGCPSSSLQ